MTDPHEWDLTMICICRWHTCVNCRLCECQVKTFGVAKICDPEQVQAAREKWWRRQMAAAR